MAYLKILTRKYDLDGCAAYAANEEKTVEDITGYALDTEKTEKRFYASVLNCGSVETAGAEMRDTKRRFGKEGKVLCYHIIQSFSPGEGTPELIHKVGMDFCRECFGDFEAVIGTHLDKGHLHNHIVVNSVSFVDGRKYRSTPKTLYALRDASDRLCRENGLSIIQPQGKGRHYAEWKAEKSGQPTMRSQIREDIDAAIAKSFTFHSFLEEMRKSGYAIKYGANVMHTAVRPAGGTRFPSGHAGRRIYGRSHKGKAVPPAKYAGPSLTGKKAQGPQKCKAERRLSKQPQINGHPGVILAVPLSFGQSRKADCIEKNQPLSV